MHIPACWAEISLSRLRHNWSVLEAVAEQAGADSNLPPAQLLAVVKANAYGHGMERCAVALHGAGAQWFGVSSIEEGVAARAALSDAKTSPKNVAAPRILVFSGGWFAEGVAYIDAALAADLTPVLWEPYQVEALAGAAKRAGRRLAVHVEIDTGMARQGVQPSKLEALLADWPASLILDGVLTHFSSPEFRQAKQTVLQLDRFQNALKAIRAAGHRPQWIHAGNSATLAAFNTGHPNDIHQRLAKIALQGEAQLLIRPGLALYGYVLPELIKPEAPPEAPPAAAAVARPSSHAPQLSHELQPVLSWKSRIVSIRDLNPGDTVGYNATFIAQRPTRIALLPVGYADGLNRRLSSGPGVTPGHVLVRGHRSPIVGRISMDLTTVDVTDVPSASIGDEAVLIGEQRNQIITAAEMATAIGTIPYEVLCAIGARVPRIFIEN